MVQGRINNIQLSKQRKKKIYLSQAFDDNVFNPFCDLLKNNFWYVYYNMVDDVLPFVTSDNPVVVADIFTENRGLFNVQINSSETGFYFH